MALLEVGEGVRDLLEREDLIGHPVQLTAIDQPIGTAPKASVHHREALLHLGFSCYLFDPAGRVPLTRRALSKATWPGVWSNSYCGHPEPSSAAGATIAETPAATKSSFFNKESS